MDKNNVSSLRVLIKSPPFNEWICKDCSLIRPVASAKQNKLKRKWSTCKIDDWGSFVGDIVCCLLMKSNAIINCVLGPISGPGDVAWKRPMWRTLLSPIVEAVSTELKSVGGQATIKLLSPEWTNQRSELPFARVILSRLSHGVSQISHLINFYPGPWWSQVFSRLLPSTRGFTGPPPLCLSSTRCPPSSQRIPASWWRTCCG